MSSPCMVLKKKGDLIHLPSLAVKYYHGIVIFYHEIVIALHGLKKPSSRGQEHGQNSIND
jgi:hypothetical protein